MLSYLNSGQQPVINVCFIENENRQAVPIDHKTMVNSAGGVEPFNVPDQAAFGSGTDAQKLSDAGFLVGFRVQVGLPQVEDPSKFEDIVVLGSNTSAVQFNMYRSQFTVCRLNSGSRRVKASYLNKSQLPNQPWIYKSTVDLRRSTIDPSTYPTLPSEVQTQIGKLSGSAFGVQQLLLDLTNPKLARDPPTLSGVEPDSVLVKPLKTYFLGTYFNQLLKNG